MDGKSIKITISPLGLPTVEAVGFNGVGCTDATKAIEKALSDGSISATRTLKTEYHSIETEGETEHNTLKW